MEIQTVQNARDGGYLINGVLAVPNDLANRHYQEVQAWIAEGNTPQVADPDPVAEPSLLDIRLKALETNRRRPHEACCSYYIRRDRSRCAVGRPPQYRTRHDRRSRLG